MGTHDLDTIEGPFTYEALPASDIVFTPLSQTRSAAASEWLKFYESDNKLKKYLHILDGKPYVPVNYDSKRRVMSLPPIINSEHSKITLGTKNVFIDCTATDETKARIVIDTLVTLFSQYCKIPFQFVLYSFARFRDQYGVL